jgi:copper chaperone CopZ
MAKIITEIASDDGVKRVSIKVTRSMQDADGNSVDVVDYVTENLCDEAISEAESVKASLESQLAEVNQEITDLTAIRDAE